MRDLTLSEQYDLFVDSFINIEPYWMKGMIDRKTGLFCDFVNKNLINCGVPTRSNVQEAARYFVEMRTR